MDVHPPFGPAAPGSPLTSSGAARTYEDAVRFNDRQIADLVRQLEHLRLARRTLLVVTADHGEAFGEHGQHGHGQSVYEEEMRVPLIVRGPGVAAGTRVGEPVSLTDVEADPFERRNLAADEPDRARLLHAALQRFLEEQARARTRFLAGLPGELEPPAARPELTPDARERLKSLGYTG